MRSDTIAVTRAICEAAAAAAVRRDTNERKRPASNVDTSQSAESVDSFPSAALTALEIGQLRLPSINICNFTGMTKALTRMKNVANDVKLALMLDAGAWVLIAVLGSVAI